MIERITLQLGLQKPIRSFVERQGRISPGNKPLIAALWPKYSIPLSANKLDMKQTFGREAPVILEIGFGDGRSLLSLAQKHPEKDFIGIEVYKTGIAKVLLGIQQQQINNIRVFCADAIEVLTHCIPEQCLEQVQLFFPDPWPKARHHKRRIVQPSFVQLVARKLQHNGSLHMATDWEDYAMHMRQVLEAEAGWINAAGKGNFIARPESRILTKFEQRGQRLGYATWDLLYTLGMAAAHNI